MLALFFSCVTFPLEFHVQPQILTDEERVENKDTQLWVTIVVQVLIVRPLKQ